MSDLELLERAAKAAGITLEWHKPTPTGDGEPYFDDRFAWCFIPSAMAPHNRRASDKGRGAIWNPLTDDGDALRLAVKLQMTINCDNEEAWVVEGSSSGTTSHEEPYRGDPYAATRRAIVRAAAAIGSQQ